MWSQGLSPFHRLASGPAPVEAKSLCLPCMWGHVPLVLGGPYSPLAYQRSFPKHAETFTQFGTGCMHHCPFHISFATQLMHSFLCTVASCGCHRRPSDNKSTAQHLKAWVGPDLTTETSHFKLKRLQKPPGSRSSAWAKVIPKVF